MMLDGCCDGETVAYGEKSKVKREIGKVFSHLLPLTSHLIFLMIQRQYLFDEPSVVGQSWHFVLSTEFSFRLEPVVEKTCSGLNNFQVL